MMGVPAKKEPDSVPSILSSSEETMSKREESAPHGDKRSVRRDDKGQFKTEVDEGRSLFRRCAA